MRCAIYVRVSTEQQTTDNQEPVLREFAERQGWEVVKVYREVVSGSGKKIRPVFTEMMLHASQRKFEVLLFMALDRLSREGISKTLGYLEQLKKWGCGYRSYTQPFLDSGNDLVDGIVLSVFAALAKHERLAISDRTKRGLARAKRQGRVLGRKPVVVDLVKAGKLKAQGLGLRPTAKTLGIAVNTLRRAYAE